jgi:hypothetical protein
LTDVELPSVEDSCAPARPDSVSADHSPTQQLEVDQLGLPFEESPTLAERFRLLESLDLDGDSPDPSESDETQSDAAGGQRGDMHGALTGTTHDELEDDPEKASHDERSWLGHFRRKRRVR